MESGEARGVELLRCPFCVIAYGFRIYGTLSVGFGLFRGARMWIFVEN